MLLTVGREIIYNIFIHSVLYSNENDWTTTTCNNIDKPHKHKVEKKKADTKEDSIKWSHLHKVQKQAN